MESANNYINQIESKLIERDAYMIQLGFFNLKKMHCFLNSNVDDKTINSKISDLNMEIIDLTNEINSIVNKYYKTIETNNQIMKNADIPFQITPVNINNKIDEHTKKSFELYAPSFKPIDIDIIQSITFDSLVMREKIIQLECLFMKINGLTIRQQYVKKRNVDKLICIELEDIEKEISFIMSSIISQKNTFSDDIKEKVFSKLLKNSLEFVEKHISFI